MQIDFERYNPFRKVDWRFRRVLQMVDKPATGASADSPGMAVKGRDDDLVKRFRKFFLQYKNATGLTQRNRLAYSCPGLWWAYELFDKRNDEGRHKAMAIESMILARMNDNEIARVYETLPEVIEWYEAIFFNVRDKLNARNWILDEVLIPAIEESRNSADKLAAKANRDARYPIADAYYDPTIKFFAYYGGRYVLDFVLSKFRSNAAATSPDDVGRFFDTNIKETGKMRAAQAIHTMEINKYNAIELFNIHTQIMQIEQSSDSGESKNDSIHKAIGSMLTDMTWAVGKDGGKLVASSPVGAYDDNSAELRDSEMHALASGRPSDTIKNTATLTLPPPRKPVKGQEPREGGDKASKND